MLVSSVSWVVDLWVMRRSKVVVGSVMVWRFGGFVFDGDDENFVTDHDWEEGSLIVIFAVEFDCWRQSVQRLTILDN